MYVLTDRHALCEDRLMHLFSFSFFSFFLLFLLLFVFCFLFLFLFFLFVLFFNARYKPVIKRLEGRKSLSDDVS